METMLTSEQIASIVDNIISGICVFAIDDSKELTPVYLNEGFCRMLGYSHSEMDRMFKNVRRNIVPEDMPRFDQAITDVLKDDGAVEVEVRTVTADGSLRWIQIRANLYGVMDGYKLIAGIVLDVTERKTVEEELVLQAERNHILLESAQEHLLDYNVRTDVLNIRFENSEIYHEEVVVKDFFYVHNFAEIHEDDRNFLREVFSAAMKTKHTDYIEFRSDYFEGDNKYHWYSMTLTSVCGADGYISRIVGRVVNIDAKKEKELELELRAEKDSLTGLYNKGATTTLITKAIEKSIENNKMAALIMVDLDHFKSVNDTFGHSMGDKVIADSGKTLNDTFKGQDIVGRMGGDEFMVFMDDIKGENDALLMANKLNSLLTRTIEDEHGSVTVTASIGIAMLGPHANNFELLYKSADMALYVTKESGRNGATVFGDNDMKTYR